MSVPQFRDLTILRAQIMNVKRARFIDITPTDVVTKIAGKNKQGKSSYLQGIEWLFGGKAIIEMEPVRRGQQVGRMYAELGKAGGPVELLVTRTITMVDDVEWTTSLTVETPAGATFGKEQTLLESLAGDLTIDPSAFLKMEPAKQFNAVRSWVDYDFDMHKALYDGDFKKRTGINGDADKARKAASVIIVPADTPDRPIDEAALIAELEKAGTDNIQLERRRNNRQTKRNEHSTLVSDAQSATERAAKHRTEAQAGFEAAIKELGAVHESAQQAARAAYEAALETARLAAVAARTSAENVKTKALNEAVEADNTAAQATRRADDIAALLAGAEDLPKEVDTTLIKERIAEAKRINILVAERLRRDSLLDDANTFQAASDEITARIAEREQAKRAAIAKAHLPVDGLGFGDGALTLNGFPLEQASTAESIDACVAIAMALNPTLKVILIRDGSSLDSEMRERIALRAGEKGYRVFMECVDNEGGERITIEDGVVKGAEPMPENMALSTRKAARAKAKSPAQGDAA